MTQTWLLLVWDLGIWSLGFVSDFVLRISDLPHARSVVAAVAAEGPLVHLADHRPDLVPKPAPGQAFDLAGGRLEVLGGGLGEGDPGPPQQRVLAEHPQRDGRAALQ